MSRDARAALTRHSIGDEVWVVLCLLGSKRGYKFTLYLIATYPGACLEHSPDSAKAIVRRNNTPDTVIRGRPSPFPHMKGIRRPSMDGGHHQGETDKAFDDPATPAGQEWKSIVATLADKPNWETIHWGRRIEQPAEAEVFIEWSRSADAANFVSGSYVEFERALIPLLQHPPSPPILVQLMFYRLHYEKPLAREWRSGMAVNLSQYMQSIDGGFAKGWVLSLASSGQIDTMDWAEGKVKTLIIVTGWLSIEEEESFNKNVLLDPKHPEEGTIFDY
ncbi:hypothetical protein MMC11_009047 [Xylographa trunciseda]|nr:hypothetical protein [Xylographa trunciseda]